MNATTVFLKKKNLKTNRRKVGTTWSTKIAQRTRSMTRTSTRIKAN
jgi:hypothetical protein